MEFPSGSIREAAPPSDEELLRLTAAGDRESFAQLIRSHQKHVVQLAARLLSSPDQAEDVAQDAFIRVYRAAGKFRPQAKFSTWLYRIVVNLCHDHRRRWKLRLSSIDAEPQAPVESSAAEQQEISARVHAAMDQLAPRQRAVLVLHRFEGQSYHEIAASTGLTESAVESLLVRAYANLRRALKDLNAPN